MLLYSQLYTPQDVHDAFEAFGANCGPCALAAILQRPVMTLRPLLEGFERRGYMNPSQLLAALEAAHASYRRTPAAMPDYGLAFLQWTGPWCQSRDAMNVRWAYRQTHTVGVALTAEHGMMFYDCNAKVNHVSQGGWVPQQWWETEVRPCITETIPRADGAYFIRWAVRVLPYGR